jgi:hypothetical protein
MTGRSSITGLLGAVAFGTLIASCVSVGTMNCDAAKGLLLARRRLVRRSC